MKSNVNHPHQSNVIPSDFNCKDFVIDSLPEIDANVLRTLSNCPDTTFAKEFVEVHRLLANFCQELEQCNAIFVANLSGKLVYVNEKFCKLSKYTHGELTELSIIEAIAGHQSKKFFEDLWGTISSGQIWHGMIKNRTKEGVEYWMQTSIFPFGDDQGSLIGYLAIINKIELRDKNKRLTEQFAEENKKLIEKKQSVSHFNKENPELLGCIKTNFEVSIFHLLEQILENYPKEGNFLQVLKQNIKNISKPISDQTRDWKTKLAVKEMQVCSLIRQGFVSKEIAAIMHLSPQTIKKHRENIRRKFGATVRKMRLSTSLIAKK